MLPAFLKCPGLGLTAVAAVGSNGALTCVVAGNAFRSDAEIHRDSWTLSFASSTYSIRKRATSCSFRGWWIPAGGPGKTTDLVAGRGVLYKVVLRGCISSEGWHRLESLRAEFWSDTQAALRAADISNHRDNY